MKIQIFKDIELYLDLRNLEERVKPEKSWLLNPEQENKWANNSSIDSVSIDTTTSIEYPIEHVLDDKIQSDDNKSIITENQK